MMPFFVHKNKATTIMCVYRAIYESAKYTLPEYDIHNISADIGEFTKTYDKPIPYSSFKYFGKCNDSNVVNNIFGDATSMWNFICSCEIADMDEIACNVNITDGDKKLVKSFISNYNRIKEYGDLYDYNQIVCGINDYQKIAFIYIAETDIHYFFDCI